MSFYTWLNKKKKTLHQNLSSFTFLLLLVSSCLHPIASRGMILTSNMQVNTFFDKMLFDVCSGLSFLFSCLATERLPGLFFFHPHFCVAEFECDIFLSWDSEKELQHKQTDRGTLSSFLFSLNPWSHDHSCKNDYVTLLLLINMESIIIINNNKLLHLKKLLFSMHSLTDR